jgi:DNA-3-methyladenine glycosylase I
MAKEIKKCGWCVDNTLYERYHDEEWGSPIYNDQKLFELLLLEGAQAGLSWITILKKREGYRKALDGFEAKKVALYGPARINELLLNPEIVRNRLKVESAVSNARLVIDIQERTGSFSDYVWQFTDHQPTQNFFRSMEQIPATTPASDRMSRAMKKDGFKYVGSTICYAYMQATGMVNDHLVSCFRHEQCRRLSN